MSISSSRASYSDEERTELSSYWYKWSDTITKELVYCGYSIYRTGREGAKHKVNLEDQGITHVLTLGRYTWCSILRKDRSDKIKYYEKHIRSENVNDDKDGDEGRWAGFWTDEKVVKFIESAMPDAKHPNSRLLIHCASGYFSTGFVVRGIMIKYKEHSLMQAYRCVDFNTILICDFPNAIKELRSLPDDEKKRTSNEELEKVFDWPEDYNKVDCLFGRPLASRDDKLPSVSFEGCPEDPYEQDEKVKKAIQMRLEMQKKMP